MKTNHLLSVTFKSYGHWIISTDHYDKNICAVTTNSVAIDEYKYGESRSEVNRGYKALRNEIIYKNKVWK